MFNSSLAKGHPAISIRGAAAALVLSLLLSAGAAYAQVPIAKPGHQPDNPMTTGNPDNLKEKIALPDLPEYTGKSKFLHGLVYNHITNNKKGPAYVMCFNAKESADQVREWWLNSLRQYRWNITYTSSDVVQGTSKDGSSCIVQISGPVYGQAKDDRSSFVVRYQAAKP